MEAIIDKAVADGTKIDAILAENDSTALGVAAALTGQELRLPARSAARTATRQPEQRRAGQAVRRRLEERQRAGQGRGRRGARSSATGTTMADVTLPDGLIDPAVAPAAGLTRPALHDAGWQHRHRRSS